MEKTSPIVMCIELKSDSGLVFGLNQRCITELVRFFSIFFTLRESRRTSDPALPRACSSALRRHPWRLGSEALRLLKHWGKKAEPLKAAAILQGFKIGCAFLTGNSVSAQQTDPYMKSASRQKGTIRIEAQDSYRIGDCGLSREK
jgi:hypothetical protein